MLQIDAAGYLQIFVKIDFCSCMHRCGSLNLSRLVQHLLKDTDTGGLGVEVVALVGFVAASQILHLDAGQIGGTAITALFLIALDQVKLSSRISASSCSCRLSQAQLPVY